MLLSFSNLNNEKQENYLYHSQGVVTWLGKGEWGEDVRRGKRRKLHRHIKELLNPTGEYRVVSHHHSLYYTFTFKVFVKYNVLHTDTHKYIGFVV